MLLYERMQLALSLQANALFLVEHSLPGKMLFPNTLSSSGDGADVVIRSCGSRYSLNRCQDEDVKLRIIILYSAIGFMVEMVSYMTLMIDCYGSVREAVVRRTIALCSAWFEENGWYGYYECR